MFYSVQAVQKLFFLESRLKTIWRCKSSFFWKVDSRPWRCKSSLSLESGLKTIKKERTNTSLKSTWRKRDCSRVWRSRCLLLKPPGFWQTDNNNGLSILFLIVWLASLLASLSTIPFLLSLISLPVPKLEDPILAHNLTAGQVPLFY